MSRTWVAFLFISSFITNVLGQWSIGPRLQGTLLTGHSPIFLPGLGLSVTKAYDKRTALSADGEWHLAHAHDFTYITGPWRLPTGDTTSGYHQRSEMQGFFAIAVGLQRTFNRRQKSREWYWKSAVGYGADRLRFIEDFTKTYSGERSHLDEVELFPFLLARIGCGYTMHLRRTDLTCELTDTWAFRFNEQYSSMYHITRHHSIAIAFSYRWRL